MRKKSNWRRWQRPWLPTGAQGPPQQCTEVKDTRLQGTYCGQINPFFQVFFFFFPSFFFRFFLVSRSIFRGSVFPTWRYWEVASIPWIPWCKEKPNQLQDLMLFFGFFFSPRKVIHRHKYWRGGGRKIISKCKFCSIQGGFGARLMGLPKPPNFGPDAAAVWWLWTQLSAKGRKFLQIL